MNPNADVTGLVKKYPDVRKWSFQTLTSSYVCTGQFWHSLFCQGTDWMLYRSLGIKMQINISSSFWLKPHEKSEIIDLIENFVSQSWHWNAIKDFFQFFAEASWKVRNNQKEKNTVWYTIKDITDFIKFFFTADSWKVFFQFFAEASSKVKK